MINSSDTPTRSQTFSRIRGRGQAHENRACVRRSRCAFCVGDVLALQHAAHKSYAIFAHIHHTTMNGGADKCGGGVAVAGATVAEASRDTCQ